MSDGDDMPAIEIEVERKYDIDDSTPVPPISGFRTETASTPVMLSATYIDTADELLAGEMITLRRRTGGHDEGWHLKTPGHYGRVEHHAGLSAELPPTFRRLIDDIVRDRPLVEIASITTERSVTHVLMDDGRRVAEVDDDRVTATDFRGVGRTWREWEVELAPGVLPGHGECEEILDSIGHSLIEAGASPSVFRSKLARALGRTSLGKGSR